jgi:DNA-binding Lrp family transcriptional regulator
VNNLWFLLAIALYTSQNSILHFSKRLKSYSGSLSISMTYMETIDSSNNHGRFEASVNIFVEPTKKTQVIDALSKLENIEEIFEVKGEFDIVSIVSATSLEEFRTILHNKILKIKGIKSTVITVVLKTHKKLKSESPLNIKGSNVPFSLKKGI